MKPIDKIKKAEIKELLQSRSLHHEIANNLKGSLLTNKNDLKRIVFY